MPATTITTPFERVLDSLRSHGTVRQQAGGWMAVCPAHADQQPSLAISEGTDGRVLLYCHAGCATNDILAELNMTVADLFPPPSPNGHAAPAIVATYPYRDRHGVLLYEVLRLAPKGFRQRKPDGAGGWVWKLDGVARVLYRLPELHEAISRGATIYIVEGEKDADRINSLGDPNIFATTASGGAGKWRPEYTEELAGAELVVVVADNDEPGRAHAIAVLKKVGPVVERIGVYVAAEGKDVSDHLDKGHRLDALVALCDTTELADHMLPTAVLVEIDPATVQPEKITWLWPGYLAQGKVHICDGQPGKGKSTITIDLAARVSQGAPWPDGSPGCPPGGVLIISAEDGVADTIVPRLHAHGADLSKVVIVQVARDPDGEDRLPSLPRDTHLFAEIIRRRGIRLVILDPLMAYLDGTVNTYKDQDVRRALAPLARIAERQEAAMLLVRHYNKGAGDAITKGGGSIGIIGLARVGLAVAADPDDETNTRRVLAVAKSNIGLFPPSLAYTLVEDEAMGCGRIQWLGTVKHTADDLLSERDAPEVREERSETQQWLIGYLIEQGGEAETSDIYAAAKKVGISERTLRHNRSRIGVQKHTAGYPPKTVWSIDPLQNGNDDPGPASQTAGSARTASPASTSGMAAEPGTARTATTTGVLPDRSSDQSGNSPDPLAGLAVLAEPLPDRNDRCRTGEPVASTGKPCPDCGQDLTGVWLTEHKRQCQPPPAAPVAPAVPAPGQAAQAGLGPHGNPPSRTVADATGTCQDCGEPVALTYPAQTRHPACEKE